MDPPSTTSPMHRASPVHLTLTPCNQLSDRRSLTITPGGYILIGRASKSEAKNLSAAEDNALFDCPVVSREHAQLWTKSCGTSDATVEIVDRKSMHGTSVNGKRIEPNIPYPLLPGDLIKFGDTVTRGADTHDGVLVKFERPNQHSAGLAEELHGSSKGFQVPEISDEESEAHSDDESAVSEAVSDFALIPSSAKTTPEKSPPKLGSQEQPIDLEGSVSMLRPVINLEDDDGDDLLIEATHRSGANNKTIVQDTYDESSDIESLHDRNTGLSQLLNSEDMYESDEEEDAEEEYRSQLSAEEDLSDSDASDLSNHADCHVDLSEDDDGPEEVSSKKQPLRERSPELGTQGSAQQASTFSASNPPAYLPPSAVADVATKPRYDPVRGSNPPHDAPSTADQITLVPMGQTKLAPTFSCGHSYRPGEEYGAGNAAASRWGFGPESSSSMFSNQLKSPVSHVANYYDWVPGGAKDPTAWAYDEFYDPRADHYHATFKPACHSGPSKLKENVPPASSTRSQMSIPNLVDDAHVQLVDTIKRVDQSSNKALNAHTTKSSKRKADEISDGIISPQEIDDSMSSEQWRELYAIYDSTVQETLPAPTETSPDEVHAPKRMKRNDGSNKTRSLAWEVTKLGTAAATGAATGAAIMVFLLSSLADRALEWAESA